MSSEVSSFSYKNQSGKMWGYRFEIASVGGKRRWKVKKGYKTKSEAMKAGREALIQYENHGVIMEDSEMSYSDFLDLWLKSLAGALKFSTIDNYTKKADLYLKPYLGSYKLNSIRKDDIRKLLLELSQDGCASVKRGLAKNTMSVIVGMIKKSFDFAVEEKLLRESPASGRLRLPASDIYLTTQTAPKSNPHIYIPKERIDAIFDRFPEKTPNHVALMLGYKCGLRIGEAFAVTWEDIDFEAKTLTVRSQIQWFKDKNKPAEMKASHNRRMLIRSGRETGFWYITAPKYNSVRTIKLDDELIALLERERKQQEKDRQYYAEHYIMQYMDRQGRVSRRSEGNTPVHFVNIRRDGEFISPRTMQHTSKVIHTDLRFPEFDFHSLRHTHATMLVENGASPMYVQQRLGHKNLAVTMKYYFHYTDKMDTDGNEVLKTLYNKQYNI